MYDIFTTEYSRELPVLPVKKKWHGAVSDLIVMLNGVSVLPQM
jgi:hypothetical protein